MGAATSRWNNHQHLLEAKRAAMVAGYPNAREGRRNSRGNGWSLIINHCSQEAFDKFAFQIEGRIGEQFNKYVLLGGWTRAAEILP